jgi:hypothetical protein
MGYEMPEVLTARFLEAVITAALFSPLVILAWKSPKAYRLVAIFLITAATLVFVGYQSYYEGAKRMYLKAMEAADYDKRHPPNRFEHPPFPPPDSLTHVIDGSAPYSTGKLDSVLLAHRPTVEEWKSTLLPGGIDEGFRQIAPLDRYYVLFTYIALCSMLWVFTFVHRLKRPKIAGES